MKKTNPVVFTWDTSHMLNQICDTVREAYMEGPSDCGAIESFHGGSSYANFSCVCARSCHAIQRLAREAVEDWMDSGHCNVLLNVFEDNDAIVRHIVLRLTDEGKLMQTPTQRVTGELCFLRAFGASFEELTKEFGFAESTIEGVCRRNADFIRYIEENDRCEDDLRDDLRNLWSRWIDGSLPRQS